MKTADKAATVVAEFLNGNDVAANTITRRLSDAGLLAPDLPEPELYDNGDAEWDAFDGYVSTKDGLITVSHSEIYTDDIGRLKFFDPAVAEELGTLLIAAAKYAVNHAEDSQE